MDPIVPALAVGGVLVAGSMYFRWRFLFWRHIERVANQSLDEVKVSSQPWGAMLQGRAGALTVRMADFQRHKGAQVVVEIPGPPGFSELSIRREIHIPWKTREIEVGSESFDQTFFVAGPLQLVLALLDAEARDLLLRVSSITSAGSRLEIISGQLQAEVANDQLPLVLPLLLAIGERFARPLEIDGSLARNATRDPEAGVRLKNLLLLARELPGHERTVEALRAACSDRSPEVRLGVGKVLGAEGRGVLMTLAENLEDDAVSAEAVSFLGRELPLESTKAILLNALDRRCFQTARACLEALGRETTGSPDAEGALTQALQHDQATLRVAAAKALGRVGTAAAVLPLKESVERFSRDPELRRATRQAIAEIQSRLPGASPGQLSLPGPEAGRLSLASDPSGQLSITAEEES